jgi:hypothetical protein
MHQKNPTVYPGYLVICFFFSFLRAFPVGGCAIEWALPTLAGCAVLAYADFAFV